MSAGDLVASATVALNGWLGPRWVGPAGFMPIALLADAIAEPERRRRVDADLARLQTGDMTARSSASTWSGIWSACSRPAAAPPSPATP